MVAIKAMALCFRLTKFPPPARLLYVKTKNLRLILIVAGQGQKQGGHPARYFVARTCSTQAPRQAWFKSLNKAGRMGSEPRLRAPPP